MIYNYKSIEFEPVFVIKKSTFSKKVTVNKPNFPFIDNLKKPVCASEQDGLKVRKFPN